MSAQRTPSSWQSLDRYRSASGKSSSGTEPLVECKVAPRFLGLGLLVRGPMPESERRAPELSDRHQHGAEISRWQRHVVAREGFGNPPEVGAVPDGDHGLSYHTCADGSISDPRARYRRMTIRGGPDTG